MSTIASLVVNLSLDAARFSSGADAAVKSAAAFEQKMLSALDRLVTDGGSRVASYFSELFKGTMSTVEATTDMANQLGVTTAALTRLQYTADINGSSAEAMSTALGKMNQNLGDVARGGGEQAAAAIDGLGLNINRLVSMSPDKAFIAIAQELSQVRNPAERASLAVDIFGKSGQNIINVLAMGANAIEAFGAKSDRIGNTLTAIKADAISDAKDAFDDAAAAANGLAISITAKVAPMLVAAAEAVANLAAWINNLDSNLIKTVAQAVAAGAAFAVIMTIIPKIVTAVMGFVKALRALAQGQAVVQALSGPKGWALLAIGLTAAAGAAKMVDSAFDEFEQKAQSIPQAAAAVAQVKTATDAAAASAEKLGDKVKQATDRLREQVETYGMSSEAAEVYKLSLAGATDAELANARALANKLEKMKEEDDRQKAVSDMTTRLREQVDTFGMSEQALAMYQASLAGANAEELRRIEMLSGQLEAMKEHKKAQDALNQRSKKGSEVKQPEIVAKGVVNLFNQQRQREADELERIRQAAEQQNAQASRQTDLLGTIAANTSPRSAEDTTAIATF